MDVVVGFDSQSASRHALVYAAVFTRVVRAHLHVVHVIDMADEPVDSDSPDYESTLATTLSEHRAHVRQILETDPLGADGIDWSYSCERGTAMTALVAVAERVDAAMIIVGQPHRGFGALLEHTMNGSVSRGLLHGRRFSILVVPEDADVAAVTA